MRQLNLFKTPPLNISHAVYNGELCIYFRYKTQTGWRARAVTNIDQLINPLYEQLTRMAFIIPNHALLHEFELI